MKSSSIQHLHVAIFTDLLSYKTRPNSLSSLSLGRVFTVSRCRRVRVQQSDAKFWNWQEEPELTESAALSQCRIGSLTEYPTRY